MGSKTEASEERICLLVEASGSREGFFSLSKSDLRLYKYPKTLTSSEALISSSSKSEKIDISLQDHSLKGRPPEIMISLMLLTVRGRFFRLLVVKIKLST